MRDSERARMSRSGRARGEVEREIERRSEKRKIEKIVMEGQLGELSASRMTRI